MSKSKKSGSTKAGTKAPKGGVASESQRKAAVAEAQAADAAANAQALPEGLPGAGAGKGKKGAAKAAKAPKPAKPKRVSLLDAAAQVLGGSKEPMNCKAMVDAVTAKGLWSSPKGKTPHATLYSAILREINEKKDARFTKTDRGLFAFNPKAAPSEAKA